MWPAYFCTLVPWLLIYQLPSKRYETVQGLDSKPYKSLMGEIFELAQQEVYGLYG